MEKPTITESLENKPSYLEWLSLYHPEEFKRRFGPRPTGYVEGDVPEDHFGPEPKEEWKK
jgi:hypothetical protein